MKHAQSYILYLLIVFHFFSCNRTNEFKYTTKARLDLKELNELRIYIETKHKSDLFDSTKNIILFPNQISPEIKYKTDIIDLFVIEKLHQLGYSEIEIDKNNNNTLFEMNFIVETESAYPIVMVKYEYMGTSRFYQSDAYFYRPINKKWCVVIDSTN